MNFHLGVRVTKILFEEEVNNNRLNFTVLDLRVANISQYLNRGITRNWAIWQFFILRTTAECRKIDLYAEKLSSSRTYMSLTYDSIIQ
jgi:hypothetical protein